MALSPTRPTAPGSDIFSKITDRLLKGGPASEMQGDRDLLKGLETRFDRAKMARRPLESQWLLNFAMYMGQQWLQWDQAARTLQRPNVPPWRVLAVANYVRVVVNHAFGRVIHNRPQAKTQPANDSPEAEESARASDKLLEYLWPKSGTKKAMDRALLWALVPGSGFVEVAWDTAKGQIVGTDKESGEPLHMGDIVTIPVSPFEFYPEPNVQEIEDLTWWFKVTLRSASWVKEHYKDPQTGKPLEMEEENFQQTEVFESQLRNIMNGGEQHGGQPKGVVVKEYGEIPSAEFPAGRKVVYAQDRVIFRGDNPYADCVPNPFVMLRGMVIPGRLWGESFVTDLIDAQRNYNKSRSQAIEIRNLMGKPKWLIPGGSLPPGKVITSAPGEHLEYAAIGGLKPEPVKGLEIPAAFFQDQQKALSEMYDISAQHPIGYGTTGVRSALAIAYLQEQDNTHLGPLAGEYQDAIELIEGYKLKLVRKFYTEDRTVTVAGADNRVEVINFRAKDIPEDVTVKVQAGSALPMSRVARQQFLLQLAQTQIPPNSLIPDPKLVLKLMEFGEYEGLYEDVTQDIRQAERENEVMKKGGQALTRDFHNHKIHIDEHNSLRKSEIYEQMDQQQQEVIDTHVQLHQAFMQQTAMAQQQMQAGQPPPGEPGENPMEADLFGQGGPGGEQGGGGAGHPNAATVQTGPEAGQHDPYGARIERMASGSGGGVAPA